MRPRLALVALLVAASCAAGSCTSPPSEPKVVPVAPICTIYCVVKQEQPINWHGIAFVSDRMSNSGSTFSPFRQPGGPWFDPLAPVIASVGVPTTYSIREAWTPWLGSNVFRGFVTPKKLSDAPPGPWDGSAWSIVVQDKTGAWQGFFGSNPFNGSPDTGNNYDNPLQARATTPSFMPVGEANAEMFACITDRTLDKTGRTTWLYKLTPPSRGTNGAGFTRVQDLLYGDTHWAQLPSAPLAPSETRPPAPWVVSPPGDLTGGWGTTRCAMTQVGDNLATRQLNMLTIRDNRLYHSVAVNWSQALTSLGEPLMRFSTETPWSDVGNAIHVNDPVTDVAVLGGQSRLDVFIVTQSGNTTRVLFTARFPNGAWSTPKDVLADANVTVSSDSPLHIAVGTCPKLGSSDGTSETEIILYEQLAIQAVRMVQNSSGVSFSSAGTLPLPTSANLSSPPAQQKSYRVEYVSVGSRPFPDNS